MNTKPFDYTKNLEYATDEDIRTILTRYFGVAYSTLSQFMSEQDSRSYRDVFTKKYGSLSVLDRKFLQDHADVLEIDVPDRKSHFSKIPGGSFPTEDIVVCQNQYFEYALVKIKKTYKARPVIKNRPSKNRPKKIYTEYLYGVMIGNRFFPVSGGKSFLIKSNYSQDQFPKHQIVESYKSTFDVDKRWRDHIRLLLDELIEDAVICEN